MKLKAEGEGVEPSRPRLRFADDKSSGLTAAKRRRFLDQHSAMAHQTTMEAEAMENLTEVRYCPECGSPLIAVPVLQCAHCGDEVALRCLTYGPRRGKYFAECIDLDITSQGESPEEAIRKLQEAMFVYIETVFNGRSAKGLVPRFSPLSHRIRYHMRSLMHLLYILFKGRGGKHLLPRNNQASHVRFCHC